MPILAFILYFLSLGISIFGFQENEPLQASASDWQVLFNGKDLKGWIPKIHHHEVGDNYANTFRVQDGAIAVNYDGYGDFDDRFGHLFYEKSFSSFHLVWEYRFARRVLLQLSLRLRTYSFGIKTPATAGCYPLHRT
jgi:hypothetical protein